MYHFSPSSPNQRHLHRHSVHVPSLSPSSSSFCNQIGEIEFLALHRLRFTTRVALGLRRPDTSNGPSKSSSRVAKEYDVFIAYGLPIEEENFINVDPRPQLLTRKGLYLKLDRQDIVL
ncbi:hypothetical protein L2E82_11656 [Cichorium intybus]|uniref:Uncharacterized protein n=1 Tax=Cichorium intybus TaxID=13427 RepID=A0ACB9GE36_CICIN|nr:hypothetical protein L2E82_11656 [Cichorium intybus]